MSVGVIQSLGERCGSVALERASVVTIEATAGELRRFLHEPLHLCADCGEDLVAFLRRGEAHASPGGVRERVPALLPGTPRVCDTGETTWR
jgi:hypothetical protein